MAEIDRTRFDALLNDKCRDAPEVVEIVQAVRRIATAGLLNVTEHPFYFPHTIGTRFKIGAGLLCEAHPKPNGRYVGVSIPEATPESLARAGEVRLRKDGAPSWVHVRAAEDVESLVTALGIRYEDLTAYRPGSDSVSRGAEAARLRTWTVSELEIVIKDSVAILEEDAEGGADRANHDKVLLELLQGWTQEEVDSVRAQISHALQSMGLPSVSGHQPAEDASAPVRLLVSSYVEMPREAPVGTPDLSPADSVSRPDADFDDFDQLLSESPMPVAIARDASLAGSRLVKGADYAERDANNRRLGMAGEEWVVRYERCRLIKERQPDLAKKVKWVAVESDGHGYDIESFDGDGKPRYIEVKTTAHDNAAFYVTRNEADVSALKGERYFLYRLFGFFLDPTGPRPGLFIRQGALADTCVLIPDRFVAR